MRKLDTRKDYRTFGISTSFSLFPSLYFQAQIDGKRWIAFAWLWIVLIVCLPETEHFITIKYNLRTASGTDNDKTGAEGD